MSAPALTPAALDRAAASILADRPLRAAEAEAWRGITGGFERTAPTSRDARNLVGGKTVDELIREAGITEHGQRPAVEIRLPGKIGRALPDWAHTPRRNLSHPPSTILQGAGQILREWGWQSTPHHLRDRRGRRCVCGAICAVVDNLGIGSSHGAEMAAGHVLAELRSMRWPHLIGDWNQVGGRTAQQAISLVHAAHNRALHAGQ